MKPFILGVMSIITLAFPSFLRAESEALDTDLELLVEVEALPESDLDQGITSVDSASELESFFESVFGDFGRGLASAFANHHPADGGNLSSSMNFMSGDRQSVTGIAIAPVGPVDISGLDFTSAANKAASYFTTPESVSRKPGATPSEEPEGLDSKLEADESKIDEYFAEQVVGLPAKAKPRTAAAGKISAAPLAAPESVVAAVRIQPVPEPSAILTASLAGLLLAFCRRR